MAHVMVLDDEPSICWAFRNFLGDDGHRVTIASTAELAMEQMASDPPDVLFLDIRLPGMDGLTALDRFRGLAPAMPVVVMTAFGTMQTAVKAIRGGAFDYLPKPFDLEHARSLVSRALIRPGKVKDGSVKSPPGEMVGSSPAMQSIFRQVALAASCDSPVLITGESGTGKELIARAIHKHGDRADRPFVPVHLAALPETLAERELFGHEKGAYTGADTGRAGLLDRAEQGTIFFDEVGEAPAAIQTKLLRVLDGGEYRSVGGGAERHLRARVVSATNRDLAGWVRSGAFRADLFYRLAVLTIHLPPLRERREDIPPLWDHFLSRIAPGRHEPLAVHSPLGRKLLEHDWPGNVRELRNAAEGAARSGQGGSIHVEHLPPAITQPVPAARPDLDDTSLDDAIVRWANFHVDQGGADSDDLYDRFLKTVEAPLLRSLQAWARGNQMKMSRRLGLHRTTLRQKLRHHGLDQ